eukprot:2363-Eustigmatos_ZCMA.PRE.1
MTASWCGCTGNVAVLSVGSAGQVSTGDSEMVHRSEQIRHMKVILQHWSTKRSLSRVTIPLYLKRFSED